jgi:hypothetical protein
MSAARVVHSAALVNDVWSGNACHYANNNVLPERNRIFSNTWRREAGTNPFLTRAT